MSDNNTEKQRLGSGAEAVIMLNERNVVEKHRQEKNYRIPEIDVPLRRARTKKEAKIIAKLNSLGLNVPKLIKVDEFDIQMEYIDGVQLKKVLDTHPEYAEYVGKTLTVMHDNEIMHGDLTTSNMILRNNHPGNDPENTDLTSRHDDLMKLYFIDFGLSFNSSRVEDMAVDIHLFKQALESKHFRVIDEAYKYFLDGYNPKERKSILTRLEVVESRGRYKDKI